MIMTSRMISIAAAESFPSSELPVQIAFVVTPADEADSAVVQNQVVLRLLSFTGTENEVHEIACSPSFYLGHVSESDTTVHSVSGILESNRYVRLRLNSEWEVLALVERQGKTLVFNDSGATRQFAICYSSGGQFKPCIVLKPVAFKHGVYTGSEFILQAYVAPEECQEFQTLDTSLLKNVPIEPALELTALNEDVRLWLHTSDDGTYMLKNLVDLSVSESEGEDTGDTTSFSDVADDVPEEPPAPVDPYDPTAFVQSVEFFEKDISMDQARKIVMQALARAGGRSADTDAWTAA